jgi:hypothetical protein
MNGGFADQTECDMPYSAIALDTTKGPVYPGFFLSAVYTVVLRISASLMRTTTLLTTLVQRSSALLRAGKIGRERRPFLSE